ncbi:MAG: magnesium transporter [bacterium]
MANIKDSHNFEQLVKKRDFKAVREVLCNLRDADVAFFIEELSVENAIIVFRSLPKSRAAKIFAYLSSDMQEHIVRAITDNEVSSIINQLFVDDAADFLEELPANIVKRVLRNASPEARELINQFLQYPPESAGSIMTAEFVDLKKNMTVAQAFKRIRRTAIDKETVYTCYVINSRRHLQGVVTVKRLFLSDENSTMDEIMEKNIIYAHTTDDQEAVAELFTKYDLLSLPIVDHENRLVGIVTIDDIVEVIQDEATEDFQKMAAITPLEKPYLKTSIFSLAKNRIMWLMILMISAMVTGGILEKYEAAFIAVPLLVTFIPMLTDTGGNAGSQSSTLIIRSMALSEITTRDFWRVLFKELAVSLLVGTALSTVNFFRLILMHPGEYLMATVVSCALLATVVLAKTIGGVLPLIAKVFKTDPAIMAAPVITTIVDALSLIIYFKIVEVFLLSK